MGEQVSLGVHGREFTVLSGKLLVSEGERQGEDWLTAEFTECVRPPPPSPGFFISVDSKGR
jgi:hypothetical protein